jgi:CRISPR/Cas system CSM-associated protein Csm2 small subunit
MNITDEIQGDEIFYMNWILKEEAVKCDGVIYHIEDEDLVWVEDLHEHRLLDTSWFSDMGECFYSNETDAIQVSYGTIWGSAEEFREDDDFVVYGEDFREENFIHMSDAIYCVDIDAWVHCNIDDHHWSEETGEYYCHSENMPDNEVDNETISEYHSSPEPINLNLPKFNTPFNIGFELEKTEFNGNGISAEDVGDYVGDYDLFKGYEADSSCGVEAITNILPLGNTNSKARKYVFSMFEDAKDIIDSPVSLDCGGHITISMDDISPRVFVRGYDLLEKIRTNLAVIYALYPTRLNKSYCRENKSLKGDNKKYSPVNVSFNMIEIRLPSAVRSVKQLKLRYDLMYKLLYYSVHGDKMSFEDVLDKLKGIIKKMYNNDMAKVNAVMDRAKSFRFYLLNEKISDNIKQYI